MADRSVWREQYQNQVAELGEDSPTSAVGPRQVEAARQLLADYTEGLLDDDDDKRVTVAQELIEQWEAYQLTIRPLRLLCCANSQNAAEALDLMEYLGIAPNQPMLPSRVSLTPSTLSSPRHSEGMPRA